MRTVASPEAIADHKLLQLPPTFAWNFDPGHLSTIGCCGDIDGDGEDECIVSTVQATSSVACLSVVSYVEMSKLDPGWSHVQQQRLVVQWSSTAGIPNWVYPPSAAPQSCSNFSFWSADVDGDGLDDGLLDALRQPPLRFLHAFQERRLAMLVLIDADAKIDLLAPRIGLERLAQSQNGVLRSRLNSL
mgnify:CR=1 FL=1